MFAIPIVNIFYLNNSYRNKKRNITIGISQNQNISTEFRDMKYQSRDFCYFVYSYSQKSKLFSVCVLHFNVINKMFLFQVQFESLMSFKFIIKLRTTPFVRVKE